MFFFRFESCFSIIDHEVFLPEYFQSTILHVTHFQRVVKYSSTSKEGKRGFIQVVSSFEVKLCPLCLHMCSVIFTICNISYDIHFKFMDASLGF